MNSRIGFFILAILFLSAGTASAQKSATTRASPEDEFLTDIPPYVGNVILGRPTDHSITLSVMLEKPASIRVLYGRNGAVMDRRSDIVKLNAREPHEMLLDHLSTNAGYEYRIVDSDSGKPLLPEKASGSFHTARPAGSSFTFTLQADSHLDGNCRPDLYKVCLANALADHPDFHIDLGDTFMSGKHPTRESALKQYFAQRYYFGLIVYAAPVFLVVGNHDGEEIKKRGSTAADGLAVWSCLQRKMFFPNPLPDSFYSGNAQQQPSAGLLEDYYAWTWGDALFVVLDPYWTSRASRGGTDPWCMTLGKTQYDWLAQTLRASKAKYKFIFIHQLVGGVDESGRGGAEAASLLEWGGLDRDGKSSFVQHRSGWEMPIHQLLVANHVNIVFHGHDHFYAKQEKDGVIYQLVPQPASRNTSRTLASEYGYVTGDFLPSAGHLRVSVTPSQVQVEYLRSAIPGVTRGNIHNGEVAAKYTIPLRRD